MLALIFMVALGAILSLTSTRIVYAAGATLDVEIKNFPAGPLQGGQTFSFNIEYSCQSTTDPCGKIDILADFPSYLRIIGVEPGNGSTPGGQPRMNSTVSAGVTQVQLFNNPTLDVDCDIADPEDSCFYDGDIATATIQAALADDAYYVGPITFTPTVTGTIVAPYTGNPTTHTITRSLTTPVHDWGISKSLIGPTPPVDTVVYYDINLCPGSNTNNTMLTDYRLQDTFDSNATLSYYSTNTGTPTISGNTITWPVVTPPVQGTGRATPGHAASDGCITERIGLTYPAGNFTVNPDPPKSQTGSNTADYIITPYDPNGDGFCAPPCVGNDPETHPFAPPTIDMSASKGVLRNPVGLNGTGRFQLNVNNNGATANAIAEDVVLLDEMPFIDGNSTPGDTEDYLPLRITNLRPAQWTKALISLGNTRAQFYISSDPQCNVSPTRANIVSTWTAIGGVMNGSSNALIPVTEANSAVVGPPYPPGAPYPNFNRCVAVVFETEIDSDNDGVVDSYTYGIPPGFSLSSPFQIVFDVRPEDHDGGTPGIDGPNPARAVAPNNTYQNCMDVLANNPDGSPNNINNRCATVTIDDQEHVAVNFQKTTDDSEIEHDSSVEFILTATVTERGSTAMIDPIFSDAIPSHITVNSWSIETTGLEAGDDVPTQAEILANGILTIRTGVTADWDNDASTPDEAREVYVWDFSNWDNPAGDATYNSLKVTPRTTGDKVVRIRIQATVNRYTAANDAYINQGFFEYPDETVLLCEEPSPGGDAQGRVADTFDADGDSDTSELICLNSASYRVPESTLLNGQIWLKNTDGDTDPDQSEPINRPYNNPPTPSLCEQGSVLGRFTDPQFSRFSCVHNGEHGDTFTYYMTLENDGNENLYDYALYNILPFDGDVGPSSGDARQSGWRPQMTGPVVALTTDPTYAFSQQLTGSTGTILNPSDFYVLYSNSTNPCRAELSGSAFSTCTAPVNSGGWATAAEVTSNTTAFPDGWGSVRSFRLGLVEGTAPNFTRWETGITATFSVPMVIPTDEEDPTHAPTVGEVAWDNFAHTAYYSQGDGTASSDPSGMKGEPGTQQELLTSAEPRKVGIRVPEYVSIGNRVWYDYNNDGIQQTGGTVPEQGVPNVTLSLYLDENNDGLPDDITPTAAGQPVNETADGDRTNDAILTTTTSLDDAATTTIDESGYYEFSDRWKLVSGKRYIVAVDYSNFDNPADPLYKYRSSDPEFDADMRDEGRDTQYTVAGGSPVDYGILSGAFTPTFGNTSTTITANSEPTGEADILIDDIDNNPTNDDAIVNGNPFGQFGRGVWGEDDDNNDNTVDFGFYRGMSVGNRIWLDDGNEAGAIAGSGSFTAANKNNGVRDTDERGIAGVTVELWRDENDNGIFETGTDVRVDTWNPLTGTLVSSVTTDAQGYYLFHDVPPEDYFVHIPASNFALGSPDGALAMYISSQDQRDNMPDETPPTLNRVNQDNDDNGVDNLDNFQSVGVTSNVIQLRATTEPINEADKDATGDYSALAVPSGVSVADGEANGFSNGNQSTIEDINSDLAVDFGFLPPPVSIGNVVWYDDDNDGVRDTGEKGVEGVTVSLYYDTDGDGTVEIGTGAGQDGATPIDTKTTTTDNPTTTTVDEGGYYLFDKWTGGTYDLQPGRYVVVLEQSNFNASATLDGFYSSADPATSNNDDVDSNDDGNDGANPDSYRVAPNVGVVTNTFVIRHGEAQPFQDNSGTTEADRDPLLTPNTHGTSVSTYYTYSGTTRTGTTAIQDQNSDLTLDFGVYKPMSLGNLVWYDTALDPGSNVFMGNGVFEPALGERGVPGVRVEVYKDDGDGNPELGGDDVILTDLNRDGATTTDDDSTAITDGNGNWVVTDLPPGQYWVHIPLSNFDTGGATPDPLFSYINSDNDLATPVDETDRRTDGGTTNDYDNQDHGQPPSSGTPNPVSTGVTSSLITLSYESERTGETTTGSGSADDSGDDRFGNDIEDDNSDLAIDFGFYQAVSIGNRIWYDADRDGTIDSTETPIPFVDGITVYLFRDTNADGIPDNVNAGTPLYDIGGNAIDTGDIISTTTTNNNGYYVFDRYDSDGDGTDDSPIPPGNYIVGIDPNEFTTGQDLQDFISTVTLNGTDDATDTDDNGIDKRPTAPFTGIDLNEVISNTVNLTHYQEASPLNSNDDTDLDTGLPVGSREGRGIPDEHANMTVDFGFFVPFAIGNRVWLDDNNQLHKDTAPADGIPDDTNSDGIADERGVGTVAMELYRDLDGNGTFEAGELATAYRTTNTDTNGYYIFDDLPEGRYRVRVAPSNFQGGGTPGPLYDVANSGPYVSSEDTTAANNPADDGQDLNDDGQDNGSPQTNGIWSPDVVLSRNNEPSTDNSNNEVDVQTGFTTGREGSFDELDKNADLTIDFGFYTALMSVGNRVFYDYNNNGVVDGVDYNNDSTIDLPDVGIPGVTVRLYRYQDAAGTVMIDNNGTVIPGGSTDDPADAIAQVMTMTDDAATPAVDETGYYLFDGLLPGYYKVVVVEENFRSGGVLRNYYSTQDRGDNPKDVNGDSAATANANNGMATGDPFENGTDTLTPQNGGIVSPMIRLVPASEPTNETYKRDTDTPLDGTPDDGQPNIEDTNGDMTQDFGFYQPQSIGNRVWFDTNSDGDWDTGELGASGVTLTLYQDTNNNGVFDSATDQIANYYYDNDGSGPNTAAYQNATDTTDANGFYLFENVPPGRYFVVVDDTNFNALQTLDGWTSTTPDVNDSTTDRDDNGINPATAGNPVPSQLIDLTMTGNAYKDQQLNEPEPSNNAADGTSFIGNNGEIDLRSNLTYDFGFVRTDLMSLGNRVWYDEDGDGLINGGTGGTNNVFGTDEWDTQGIAGVTLSLYRDNVNNGTGATTPDGIPDGVALATTTTIADDPATTGVNEAGYYLFSNLVPGNYIVAVDGSNFSAGNPLFGLQSTVTGTNNSAPRRTDENNDNGIDTLNPTYGIMSATVNLAQNSEPTDEQAQDKDPNLGDGSGIDADDSDLTIDFGFHEPMSLGNQVFYDYNDNGILDGTENGISGVQMLLYRTDSSGNPLNSGDITNPADAIATDTTDSDGFYLFSNLPPGYYRVVVSEANFTSSSPIQFLLNSTGVEPGTTNGNANIDTDANTADGNSNENGIDPATADTGGVAGVPDAYENAGVPSPVIELGARGSTTPEPTGEVGSNDATDGPNRRGTNGETDDNSNLAVDFGFVPTAYYSIGNRVWIDDGNNGAGGTTAANVRNGVFDTGEIGVSGVTVNLYRNITGNEPTNPASPFRTTTTDANGNYLFDELPAGDYIVSIAKSNFDISGPLTGYASTTANVNPASPPATESPNASDNNDNRNLPNAGTLPDNNYGIISAVYTLDGTEPTAESSPDNAGADSTGFAPDRTTPIPDVNSDLTIDFGFYRSLSLGNRVWFDVDNDANIDSTENGVSGVTVSLYADTTGDGVPDGPAIQTDTTDSGGYYLFNNLLPGQYVIGVDNANFSGSNPLTGFTSSTGFTASPATPNAGADLDDNGKDTLDPTYGILSDTVTLAWDNAPTGDSQTSGQAADGPNFRGINNEADNNSDMTWDFGFYSDPMSLGNRVWIDDGNDGSGGTIPANVGNGTYDNNETLVPNVAVELYVAVDTNGDGTPDAPASTATATTTTDANGFYIFENLPPGPYIVKIASSNWNTGGPLDGYYSTTTGPDNKTTDNDDNGIDNTNPESNGILSNIITLVKDSEPPNETSPDNATPPDDTGDKPDGSPIDDDDSNLTVDFGFRTAYDWGDAPDTYGTDNNTTNGTPPDDGNEEGPSHRIIPQLRLGSVIDDETSGQPSTGSNGDDTNGGSDDEDGVTFPSKIIPQTTAKLDVSVFNNTGSNANLIAWFDWNGNGVFDEQYDSDGDSIPDTPEYVTVTVPSSASNQIISVDVPVPAEADINTGGTTHARFRLTTDSISPTEPTGSKNDGEVEDYQITVDPPGVYFEKDAVDTNNNSVNSVVAGTQLRYVITLENSASGTDLIDQTFTDTLPTGATDGIDPATVAWECTGTNGATCNAANATTANGTGNPVSTTVDLPAGGKLVFVITATVNSTANSNITNTANLNPINLSASETVGVIFDPPFGTKVGVLNGNNVIRWTMVWYNTGARQAATITDTLPANQTFAGNLVCTVTDIDPGNNGAGGVGTETTLCQEAGGTVTWTGFIDTGNPSRVEIAFDVTIPGGGTYTNTSTFNGTSTASAAGVVDTNNPSGPPGNAVGELLDPVIVKFVNPEFALPGEDVVWTVIVRNPNASTPLYDVSFSDNVPPQLDILSVDADAGNVTVSGNNVTWQTPIMPPLQEVSVRINTRLRDVPPGTSVIINTAVLMTGDLDDATLRTTLGLPETGEPQVWLYILVGVGSALTVILVMVGAAYRRWQVEHL